MNQPILAGFAFGQAWKGIVPKSAMSGCNCDRFGGGGEKLSKKGGDCNRLGDEGAKLSEVSSSLDSFHGKSRKGVKSHSCYNASISSSSSTTRLSFALWYEPGVILRSLLRSEQSTGKSILAAKP
ncbi:hypothetical protein G3A_17710 [Bacillus sp. 17376]|nr:hypothetical protein G3A_17710 [Bacillus sp. 17376]